MPNSQISGSPTPKLAAGASVAPPLTGRRESNKREKLSRIKAAAYELFNEKGYEATTVREIAERAGVGFGTLFSYAPEKRHLLFLLYAEISQDLADRAFRAADKPGPLLDQIVAVFAPFYRAHARNPKMSRALLGELTFTTGDTMPGQFAVFDRTLFVRRIAAIVERSKGDGRVGAATDSGLVARVIFSLFAGAVREWLAGPHPIAAAGIAELRREIALIVAGMPAVAGAAPASPAKPNGARRIGGR